MSEEKPLSDPYTGTSSTPPPAGKLEPPALGGFSFGLPSVPQVEDQYESPPDFLFPENFDTGFRRSWGERLTFHIGAAYLVGLSTGGSYGLVEGLRASQGERRRIRINSVLNSMGKRGPGWGNSLGCVGAPGAPSTWPSDAGAVCDRVRACIQP
jgi:import inner membrane translocase subunit TIM23